MWGGGVGRTGERGASQGQCPQFFLVYDWIMVPRTMHYFAFNITLWFAFTIILCHF